MITYNNTHGHNQNWRFGTNLFLFPVKMFKLLRNSFWSSESDMKRKHHNMYEGKSKEEINYYIHKLEGIREHLMSPEADYSGKINFPKVLQGIYIQIEEGQKQLEMLDRQAWEISIKYPFSDGCNKVLYSCMIPFFYY